MQLIDPNALWLFLLPAGLTVLFLLKRRKPKSTAILPLSPPADLIRKHNRRTKFVMRSLFLLQLVSFALIVLVIARPSRLKSWNKKWAEGVDIVLALDVSESMDATDFKPNRLEVAKSVIRRFIENRENDRIAIVLFGGESVTKSPLTRDYDFLKTQLQDVRLRELKQGTAIGMALASAVGRLRNSKAKSKVTILLTDGDSNVGSINPITAANLAAEERIKVYTIGIGKDSRVLVPIYSYDSFGRKTHLITKVPSYLNPELLKEIARITNAKAYLAKDGNSLDQILREINQLEKTKIETTKMEEREETFFRFALLATLLMGMAIFIQELRFRRVIKGNAMAI